MSNLPPGVTDADIPGVVVPICPKCGGNLLPSPGIEVMVCDECSAVFEFEEDESPGFSIDEETVISIGKLADLGVDLNEALRIALRVASADPLYDEWGNVSVGTQHTTRAVPLLRLLRHDPNPPRVAKAKEPTDG